ncbi:MAG: NmrA family NAD(P)-binding protein, partial [Kangiellaceae bacterium]|nr:NmrA family NAD(P)-binding protein [Kangiellaceae bacterium]
QQGVEHITLLSGRGETVAQSCEQIVQSSGLGWTVIRASWFAQNFTEGLFHQLLMNSAVELPVGNVKEPFIDIDDISEIAYESLVDPKHIDQLYEVTGPELLSFPDVINRVNKIFGKQIRFQQVPVSDFSNNMAQIGLEPSTIDMLEYLFCHVLDGRNEQTTNDVHRALGRHPRSFNQFLFKNAPLFA